jgi:diaminohydroxyphosphoribosylaminopyrimidine deaminase/5-amino-6-(5-phosphoribosylamino)uracil reductase
MVGAVLVCGNEIVGTGYHHFAGGDHAEIDALKHAGKKARGASLYLNLEPCSHFGRTPPCTGALIAAQIKEVVAGMKDPNPLVAGRGFRQLRRAGIGVRFGLLQSECERLNEAFTKFITRRLPFVTLKMAATLDGRIAAATGDARWISGPESRELVHRLRNQVDAVSVGSGTVLADDPQLTCRIPGGRNPWRVVLDTRLRISPRAQIFSQSDPEKTIIVTRSQAPIKKTEALEARGARVLNVPLQNGKIGWSGVLRNLAKLNMTSVLIEGGSTVAASALKKNIVDKALFFYAPKILGADAFPMFAPLGIRRASEAIRLERLEFRKCGADVMISGYLRQPGEFID